MDPTRSSSNVLRTRVTLQATGRRLRQEQITIAIVELAAGRAAGGRAGRISTAGA